MAAFSQTVQKSTRQPMAIVKLGPADWCDTWPDRPATSVAVGLSAFSEANALTCLGEAVKAADDLLPRAHHTDADWIDARNELMMLWAISCAMCDPNDATTTFMSSQDSGSVAQALKPETIRFMWDELEKAIIARSPVRNEATDEELAQLAEHLRSGSIAKVAAGQQMRLRKMAAYMLDELVCAAETSDDDTEAEAVELP